MTQQDCLSCDVIAGRVSPPGGFIFGDDLWSLTHGVSPVYLAGFLILQPKRHVEHIANLTGEEAASLGPLLSAASHALMKVQPPEKVYVSSFGTGVKHVHFYLMPRPDDTPEGLIGASFVSEVFSGRWACSDAEAADVAGRVRVELAKNRYL